jgi:hypothetical protein
MAALPYVLNTSLADLAGTWLELRCCGGVVYFPLRLLARAAHPQSRLRDVLPQLRCKRCHDRPATVALIEDPAGQHGYIVMNAQAGTDEFMSGQITLTGYLIPSSAGLQEEKR